MPTARQAGLPNADKYRVILAEAARLHERYVASNPETFNVFSVLGLESYEVKLHSPFLAALLDHQRPREEERSNLKAFLESVVKVNDFKQRGVRVEREKFNIDILITNTDKKAVIVENKIWARDGSEQLQTYYWKLVEQGFPKDQILICYLTPYGDKPSSQSVGNIPDEIISSVAYKDRDFQDWLLSCQQRAYDEPELRESVAQYLRIVQRLTGTDVKDDHVQDLINLCLENDHLALVHDLRETFYEAWIQLMQTTFAEIAEELTARIKDLPEKHEDYDVSSDRISSFVYPRGEQWCGLSFRLTDSSQLGVGVERGDPNGVFLGIKCIQDESGEAYVRIQDKLRGGDSRRSNEWPWWKYADAAFKVNPRDPSRKAVAIWSNYDRRKQFVAEIVEDVAGLWNQFKDAGFYRLP